jgi:hypothetical protein
MASKKARNSLKKVRLAHVINRIEAYKTSDIIDIEGLEDMLKGHYERYRTLSTNIQEEFKLANADQAEYDVESETVIQTENWFEAA